MYGNAGGVAPFIVTFVSEIQPLNASYLTACTLAGIVTLVKPQLTNVFLAISVTPSGIVTLVN